MPSSKPTQEQLDKFWNGLQGVLNDAGVHLDLSNPRDLCRIQLMTIKNANYIDLDGEVTRTFPFAENPNVDVKTVSDEELMAMQKAGKPSPDRLAAIYTAAREGRLNIVSVPECGWSERPLIVDKNGGIQLYPDGQNVTEMMKTAARAAIAPVAPKPLTAGIGTRIRAFFGSESAKAEIRRIEERNRNRMEDFEDYKKCWEASKNIDPELRIQMANNTIIEKNIHGIDDDSVDWAIRQPMLITKAHKEPIVNAIGDMTDSFAADAAGALSEMMKKGGGVTPDAVELATQILYQKKLGNDIREQFSWAGLTDYEKGVLSEDKLGLAARQAVKGSPEYVQKFKDFCENEYFRVAVKDLNAADLKAFAENPAAAADALYNKFADSMKKGATAKEASDALTPNHPKLEEVKVGKPAKDDSAVRRKAPKL